MIKYSLGCENSHHFDGWFSSSQDFDDQKAAGWVECPMCGSKEVNKQLMAPSVRGTKKDKNTEVALPSDAQAPALAAPNPEQAKLLEMMRELKRSVEENADNVGDEFSKEARKMHYGETEARAIYGKATPKEASELIEEGVQVHPLPILPDEHN